MNPFVTGIRARVVLAVHVALLAFCSSALASEDGNPPWQFELTPYLFAASLSGTTGLGGVTADINVPVDKLVSKLDGVFMGIFEARRGNWLLDLDVFYVRLEGEGSRSWQGPLGIGSLTGSLETTARQQVYQPSVGYRIYDDRTAVDLIGAVRYTKIDTKLNLVTTTGPLLPGGQRTLDGGKNWWDPVVGARVTVPVAENWSLMGYVDVGGFDLGSKVSYQASVGANWQFARDFSLKAGYRYLQQDFEEDGFIWDIALEGFYFGLGIRF